MGEAARHVEALNYPECLVVNAADTWDEGLRSYLGRSVQLLPAGDAYPKGAMNISDGMLGCSEVSSGSSTCRLSREGPDIRMLRSNRGTGTTAPKVENSPVGGAGLKG